MSSQDKAGKESEAGDAAASPVQGGVGPSAKEIEDRLGQRERLGRNVVGVILVGGAGRRMGRDKTQMRLGGRPVVSYLAEQLAIRTEEVWAIGRSSAGAELPQFVQWHLDLRPGCGPLGGIATALQLAGAASSAGREGTGKGSGAAKAALVLACDMPFVSGHMLDRLLEARQPDRPASVFRNPMTGRIEPMPAIYEPMAIEAIDRALGDGRLAVTELLEAIGAHVIDVPEGLADELSNVNTPEDLQAAQLRFSKERQEKG